ncbi:MAG: D-alanine--D-alanine ligase family protein [Myxococcota bacterium]
MRIAFTHNVQRTDSEAEAEFDTAETVEALTAALERLGHEVDSVDVACPVADLVARLRAFAPDLVFNTAEGSVGRDREAFYPALFEQMGLPYTGSDAFACTVTLDKRLSKLLVAEHGVPAPRGVLVERADAPVPDHLDLPVIVKPNFEGSSKGITADAIVRRPEDLRPRLEEALARFPEGVLVEEFVEGRDVVVPFVEGVSPETGGVLPASDYVIAGADGPVVYDYALKHHDADSVGVRVPAELPGDLAATLERHARAVLTTLHVRDVGRIDWRVTPDGRPFFLEVNALPSLEPGAALYEAAALAGVGDVDAVLAAIVDSASRRHGVSTPPRNRHRRAARAPLRVGLLYNLKRESPGAPGVPEDEAEFDSPATIEALSDALASFGHDVLPLEATPDLLGHLQHARLDVAFNIAEGLRGRSREAVVPALLELLDIPYTGSDPATLALTLDKGLAKRIVREAGVPTPRFAVLTSPRQRLPRDLRYPVIVKPVAEGSSKGVVGRSVAEDEADAREAAGALLDRYGQPALVEEFLPGREFTVGLLGDRRPEVLPLMEIVFGEQGTPHPVYAFAHKQDAADAVRYEVPARVEPALRREIASVALRAFRALGCRDVARIDLRLDRDGRPGFIECNPLPGLTPGWSDLCLIAEAAGMDHASLVGRILRPALRRRREQVRARGRGRGGDHA